MRELFRKIKSLEARANAELEFDPSTLDSATINKLLKVISDNDLHTLSVYAPIDKKLYNQTVKEYLDKYKLQMDQVCFSKVEIQEQNLIVSKLKKLSKAKIELFKTDEEEARSLSNKILDEVERELTQLNYKNPI